MTVVLDTNVVLDWLVFRDPALDPLRQAIGERRLALVTHPPALDELRRVLAYPQFKLALPKQVAVLQHYESQASLLEPDDSRALPDHFPRCRDPDDQHFLLLSYHVRAAALVTKDKDLLRLRRRGAKFGLTILNPPQLLALLALA